MPDWTEHLRRRLAPSRRQARFPPPADAGAPGGSPLDGLWQEVRTTARTLGRERRFAAAAVLTLGVGIGATTSIFSVVHGVLIKPLPYPDSDLLVRVVHSVGGVAQSYFSDAVYLAYADNTQAFADIGVWSPGETATVTGLGHPEEVRALVASRSILTTLAVRAELGRWFSAGEDAPGAPDAVMLGHGYWQRRFGADHGVLDRALIVNGRPHQIVGVMPAAFAFGGAFDVILPLRINPGAPIPSFRLLGVARLKPGVTLARANADSARILRIWLDNSGRTESAFRARYGPLLQPLKADVVGDVGTTLWLLMGAIGVVLLMACANAANLLLVRAEARRQEFAIRAALGASRARIARQLLVESLVLALVAGLLGIGLAYGGVRVLMAIGPSNLPRLSEVSIDLTVLGFALAISAVAGLLFGMVPIVKLGRSPLAHTYGVGRAAAFTRERQRSQHILVAAQVALAIVLLVSAGLMIRSFEALRRVPPGFIQPESVQTFSVTIPAATVPEPERVTRMQHDMLTRIAAIPGVTAAAFTTRVPTGTDRSSTALAVEGRPDDGRTPLNRQVKIVSPGVFSTLGTPVVAGRDFTWADLYGMRDVAIVSENLARELWGSPDAALGKRLREYYDRSARWREVVGVAGDVHDDGAEQAAPATVYWPAQPEEALQSMSGYQSRRVTMVVRTPRAGTQAFVEQARDAVSSVGATLALAQVSTLDAVYRQSMARTSFTLIMLAIAGVMALALGVGGIYGVVSYAVAQRRREVGIRLALGARGADIRGLFVRRGIAVGGTGAAAGIAAAALVTRSMQSLLFGISPLDPVAFAAAPIAVAATALLASYVPACRATNVDPVETLRAE